MVDEFVGTPEFFERLNRLKEKFRTVGLNRGEFIELCERLDEDNDSAKIRYYIAAIQLPTEETD